MKAAKGPIILLEGEYDAAMLAGLRRNKIWKTVDIIQRQAEDLFEILHPSVRNSAEKAKFVQARLGRSPELAGDWVYYPWNGHLLHCLGRQDQYRLRTNRNQNLVTAAEQQKLAAARIAIAGLSVGGGIAAALAYSGIGSGYSLADFDVLETPNLNRIQAALDEVGEAKADIVAHRIWGVDPYMDLSLYPQGISEENLPEFIGGSRPADVLIDEIDDFKMKVQLRRAARTAKIPVLMMTALGDTVLIDVERYDQDPSLEIFNGLIGDLEARILANEVTAADARRYAAEIVGIDNVPTRAIQSLLEMGKTLVGRPQLGSTVALEAAAATFVVRQLLLGSNVRGGRYRIDLNQAVSLTAENTDTDERRSSLDQLFSRK